MLGHSVRIECLLVCPLFENDEMSGLPALLENLGADEARILAARVTVLLEHRHGRRSRRRHDFDIRYRIERRIRCRGTGCAILGGQSWNEGKDG